MALDGQIELYTSQSIINETTRILRDKFKAQQPEIDRALAIMGAAARKVELTVTLDVVKDDPKDNHILECAVAAKADAVVTGDKSEPPAPHRKPALDSSTVTGKPSRTTALTAGI